MRENKFNVITMDIPNICVRYNVKSFLVNSNMTYENYN